MARTKTDQTGSSKLSQLTVSDFPPEFYEQIEREAHDYGYSPQRWALMRLWASKDQAVLDVIQSVPSLVKAQDAKPPARPALPQGE